MKTTSSKKISISLEQHTKNKLISFGRMDQTFDELINELLEHVNKCDRWWCNNR